MDKKKNLNVFSFINRIRFGNTLQKCRDCRATAHTECKSLVPLPCVPTGNTPTLRGIPVSIVIIISTSKHFSSISSLNAIFMYRVL